MAFENKIFLFRKMKQKKKFLQLFKNVANC